MKRIGSLKWVRAVVAVAGMATLAGLGSGVAEAKRKPPVVVAPPPPPAPVIPPRPYPPFNASPNLPIPPIGADGLYRSVNRNISPAQTLWNFRSAYNVAALNCNPTQFAAITEGYRSFLRTHARALTAANRKVDAEFKAQYGSRAIVNREKYMTEVYNHYALPPTVGEFCNAVLAISTDPEVLQPASLQAFATRNLPNIEIVFDTFYRNLEKYRIEIVDWNARYSTAYAK